MPIERTAQETRELYQKILLELLWKIEHRKCKPPEAWAALLTDRQPTAAELHALTKQYRLLNENDECPQGMYQCADGSCVDTKEDCPGGY